MYGRLHKKLNEDLSSRKTVAEEKIEVFQDEMQETSRRDGKNECQTRELWDEFKRKIYEVL